MSTDRVRQVERSYMSFVLKQNPNFYEQANPVNQTAYEFSNGRRFTGRRPYSNYFPMEFHVIYEGEPVVFDGEFVMEELTEAEYLAEIA